ncbi:hypothetical protein CRU92_04075 [Arcobacter sp. FW59]|nr:hypothetical protein CRU92_04075 [Arcobacter sp. FW59]
MLNLKSKISIILVIILLILFMIYDLFKKDSIQDTKIESAGVTTIVKIEKELDKKENIVKDVQKKIEQKQEKEIEEKGKILFSSSDETGRYNVQLLNVVDIEVPKRNSTRYIPIMGEIEDNNIVSEFTISISENYLDYLSDLKFKIVDNENIERDIETYTYFLGTLDLNSNYNIKLKISGDTLDGEIKSSSKLPDFMIEELSKDEPVQINVEEYNRSLIFKEENN